ncbi:hypothetical protein HK096_008337, partial [Nowakowskiella sp. JEL0078]
MFRNPPGLSNATLSVLREAPSSSKIPRTVPVQLEEALIRKRGVSIEPSENSENIPPPAPSRIPRRIASFSAASPATDEARPVKQSRLSSGQSSVSDSRILAENKK